MRDKTVPRVFQAHASPVQEYLVLFILLKTVINSFGAKILFECLCPDQKQITLPAGGMGLIFSAHASL